MLGVVVHKDKKQRHQLHKVYSVETCTWVTKTENNGMQDSQQRPFKAVDPKGNVFYSDNITRFAKEHGLNRQHISGVLHGRAQTHAGWRFEYA